MKEKKYLIVDGHSESDVAHDLKIHRGYGWEWLQFIYKKRN